GLARRAGRGTAGRRAAPRARADRALPARAAARTARPRARRSPRPARARAGAAGAGRPVSTVLSWNVAGRVRSVPTQVTALADQPADLIAQIGRASCRER